MTIGFTVPGVPRGKARPRFVRATGHAYTPEETRSYEGMIRFAAAEAMKTSLFDAPFDKAVSVNIIAKFAPPASYSAKKRARALSHLYRTGKPDIDQIVKVTLDGMNGVVYNDDAAVCYVTAVKLYTDGTPQLEVVVTPR